jgi:hypothetical protein
MRRVIALALLSLAIAAPASAEIRTFVVNNDADDYGVDRCLVSGSSCGTLVANAYCRSQDYTEARSFHKVERDEVTGSPRTHVACRGSCGQLVAIECTR